jgi:hypothetical protein
MSEHITISPTEAADRLAVRELVEAYAERQLFVDWAEERAIS